MSNPKGRRDARHLKQGQEQTRRGSDHKLPITVERIVSAALEIVSANGYEALSMRKVSEVLETGPSSLYAHVVNKADLDELLLGYLCKQLLLPTPDPSRWQSQIFDVCCQIRDQILKYPGISQAGLATAPTNTDIIRINEGMLAIFVAGNVDPQRAAWGIDALMLYINAYCLEQSILVGRPGHVENEWVVSREELLNRFENLSDEFPLTKKFAKELTSGEGHERFDFTVRLIISGLALTSRGNP